MNELISGDASVNDLNTHDNEVKPIHKYKTFDYGPGLGVGISFVVLGILICVMLSVRENRFLPSFRLCLL